MAYEREIVNSDFQGRGGEPRGSIPTSPSAESSTALFFVVFLAVVAVADLVWRVELRVERVDAVVTGSVPSSSPRFLLSDFEQGGCQSVRAYLRHHT